MSRVTGRASDERLLAWVKARAKGIPTTKLVKEYRVPPSQIIVTTNAVKRADEAESGEGMRGAYW